MKDFLTGAWNRTNGFKTHFLCLAIFICIILKKWFDVPQEFFYGLMAAALMSLRSGVAKTTLKVIILIILPIVFLTGCVSATYEDKDGNKVSYLSVFKDIEASKVKAAKTDKGVTLEVGKINSDVSEVVKEVAAATLAGVKVGALVK